MIPVPEVDAPILEKVVEYCAYFYRAKQAPMPVLEEEVDEWERRFLDVEVKVLFVILEVCLERFVGGFCVRARSH